MEKLTCDCHSFNSALGAQTLLESVINYDKFKADQ